MSGQVLDRTLTAYRIGDPAGAFPIFDAMGSTLAPGRWNTRGSPVIYASEHYATAVLEKLAHGGGALPPNQHYVVITIPRGVSYEVLNEAALPGWDAMPATVSKTFGERWALEKRAAILIAPSVIARVERNIVVNPAHPDFAAITASLHQPVYWDRRLFG